MNLSFPLPYLLKTKTAGAGRWCAVCHHMITWLGPGAWAHVSEEDWSGTSCHCVNVLVPCKPG